MFLDDKANQDDTFGGRLVCAREAQELTSSQLARRLGVKTTTVQAWETDRSEPRSNRLPTIAGLLNVSPTWLLTGAGENPANSLTETDMMHIRAAVKRMRKQVLMIAGELEQLEQRLDSYQSFQE